MPHSKHSSKQNSHNNQEEDVHKTPTTRNLRYATIFLFLAILGFADATYLTIKHFSGTAVTCSLTQGCDVVTGSVYSEIFGIPVALFGALFYLSIILLSVYFFDKKHERALQCISKITWLGLGAAIYFSAIQAFVLQAWCQFCILSAITSTLLFITGMKYKCKR